MKKTYVHKSASEREFTDHMWSGILEKIELKNDYSRESVLMDCLESLNDLDDDKLRFMYFHIINSFEERQNIKKALMSRIEEMSLQQLEICLNVSYVKQTDTRYLNITNGVLKHHLEGYEEDSK